MISAFHLAWIIPTSVFAGIFIAALMRSNDR